MNKTFNRLSKVVITIFIGCLATASNAQNKLTLNIGDHAPELKYAKWIKGTPFQQFENNRLYVLEFWATWCGPCKAAMPHLTELAKKYQDQATFIGVNIWEKTGDKPYESSLPAVTQFVNSIGDKMGYNVVADNNEQHMANNWMIAAGQRGIPSTFLVQEGKIIWIGHPMNLDSIMESVIAGKYDMAAFKAQFTEIKAKNEAMTTKFRALEPIQKAQKAKEYEKALALIDAEMEKKDPMLDMSLRYMKLSILLEQQKEDKAIEFAHDWIKRNKDISSTVASILLQKDGLSKQTYLYAIELYKSLLTREGVAAPLVQHEIAAGYARAGDYKSAVAFEEQAINGAQLALKEGKFLGTILDYTVTDYEKQLATYKKKL